MIVLKVYKQHGSGTLTSLRSNLNIVSDGDMINGLHCDHLCMWYICTYFRLFTVFCLLNFSIGSVIS